MHLPEIEWLGSGTELAVAPGVDFGILVFPDRGSHGREILAITLGAEYAARFGDVPNEVFFGLTLGWGHSSSLIR